MKPTREKIPKHWKDKHRKAKPIKTHTPKEIYDRRKQTPVSPEDYDYNVGTFYRNY